MLGEKKRPVRVIEQHNRDQEVGNLCLWKWLHGNGTSS